MKTDNRRGPLRLAATALVMAAVMAACGGDDPAATGTGGSEGAAYNDADVEFLQQMVPHHEQAIEMAEMVESRTDRPELNTLAKNIIESQSAEIEEINAMLEEADADAGDAGMDHGGMDMGMSEEDIDALADAEGEEFDVMFAEMMIEHHQSAIAMANDVLEGGENADVATLAQGIIDEQQKEIDDLETWLQEWGA